MQRQLPWVWSSMPTLMTSVRPTRCGHPSQQHHQHRGCHQSLSLDRLRRSTLFVDVLSVKVYGRTLKKDCTCLHLKVLQVFVCMHSTWCACLQSSTQDECGQPCLRSSNSILLPFSACRPTPKHLMQHLPPQQTFCAHIPCLAGRVQDAVAGRA